jgi:hypothetical protein
MRSAGKAAHRSHFSEKNSSRDVRVQAKASRPGRKRSISRTSVPALREADAEAARLHQLQHVAREASVAGVIGIGREGQHDLFDDAQSLVLARVLLKQPKEVGARRAGVEFTAIHPDYGRHVAISALMAAAAVGVRGQCRVLPGLTGGSVDDSASLNAHAI